MTTGTDERRCHDCGISLGPPTPLQRKALVHVAWCVECMAQRDPNGLLGTPVKLARRFLEEQHGPER